MKNNSLKEMWRVLAAFGKEIFGSRESLKTAQPEERTVRAPSSHPLVAAAEAYVTCAHEYDAYCDKNGVYEAARKDNIQFTRRTQFPAFKKLEVIVGQAVADIEVLGDMRDETITALIDTAKKLKNISTDPRSAVFMTAQHNYVSLGNCFKGPKVGYALSAFIDQAKEHDKKLQAATLETFSALASFLHRAEYASRLHSEDVARKKDAERLKQRMKGASEANRPSSENASSATRASRHEP
jgi:hypothetical protein